MFITKASDFFPTTPSDEEIIELVNQKQEQKAVVSQNWIVSECVKEITRLKETIVKLETLIEVCKDPKVVHGIELFVGKR